MDGFEEPYWGFYQVLSWAYLRKREIVHFASPLAERVEMHPQETGTTQPGGSPGIRTRPISSLYFDIVASMDGGAHFASSTDAVAAVLMELRRGSLRAWGLRDGREELQSIPQIQWTNLDIYYDRESRPYASPPKGLWGGATQWHELRFLRSEALEVWPDPTESPPTANSAEPLTPLTDKDLRGHLKLDTWTLTEALFLLHGQEPLGYESADALMSHFLGPYHFAVNSIHSKKLCDQIEVAGKRRFIDSPANWLSWAERKGLSVPERVRDGILTSREVEKQVNASVWRAPTDAEALKEVPNIADWFRVPVHKLEDCLCFLLNKHIRRITLWGEQRDEFERLRNLAIGAILGKQLQAREADGSYWLRREDFIAWAQSQYLHLDNLERLLTPQGLAGSLDPYKTGLAGRPTIKGHIRKEFLRRVRAGQAKGSLAAEARHLVDWAMTEHPDGPSVQPRSVQNMIREDYNQLVRPKSMK